MTCWIARSTIFFVFAVSLRPLQARATILCVMGTFDALTRSCAVMPASRRICAIGCSPYSSVESVIRVEVYEGSPVLSSPFDSKTTAKQRPGRITSCF